MAGLAASLAIATRPNLAPLVIPCALYLSFQPGDFRRRSMAFAAGCVPGVLLVAAVNDALYGSPLTSGYGTLSGFYSTSGLAGTAGTYIRWLWDTESVLVAVVLVLPFARALRPPLSAGLLRFSWLAVLFLAILLTAYAPYIRFHHWTFLRFLLPAIPVLLIASVGLVCGMLARSTVSRRAAVLAFIALMFPFAYLQTAVKGDAFALKEGFKQQFEVSAAFAARELPADAAFIGLTQTGSLRYYAQRLTLRFDLIEPADVDALTAHLRSRGFATWLALEPAELADFDARFRGTAWSADRRAAAIPLPPHGRVLFGPLR